MTFVEPTTGWLILGIFSLVWVALGWFWGRGAKTFDDRALAGRKIGLALGTATTMATWVTTNTTMVAPQFAYQLGVWGMFGYSLAAIGLLLFSPMARRIRSLMPKAFTSGDFVRTRYGVFAWAIFLCISAAYALGWLVTMAMAGGVLLEALAGIPYKMGMTIITVVCMAYTLLGGMRAVVGTDFIQSMIILVGIVVIAIIGFSRYPVEEVHATLSTERPALLSLLMPASIMFLFNTLLFGVGEIFHSNVWWSRALAFREGVGARAFLVGGLLWMPVPIVAGSIALLAPVLGINIPDLDKVGPVVVAHILGDIGAIVILIVVLSSLASSLDSLLAATSDLLTEDVYRRLIRPRATDRELGRVVQIVIVLLGVLAVALAWAKVATLGEVLNLSGALVASTIWPIAAGIYWRRTGAVTAALAMLLGCCGGLLAYFSIGFYTGALVSAAVSMVVTLLGSVLFPASFDFSAFAAEEEKA